MPRQAPVEHLSAVRASGSGRCYAGFAKARAVDLNLESLKNEILDYLEHSEFAVFRSFSGGLDGILMITWDIDRFPDYRQFLEVARKAGVKLVMFASRELEEDEIDELLEEVEETNLTRDERRDVDRRINEVRRRIGAVCSLELAFDYNSHLYVYEAQPDWYEEFLDLSEEISAAHDTMEDGADGLGGYYSAN
jgi:hypothetical protein